MQSVVEVKKLSKTYEYYRKEAGLQGSLKSLFRGEKLFKEDKVIRNVFENP